MDVSSTIRRCRRWPRRGTLLGTRTGVCSRTPSRRSINPPFGQGCRSRSTSTCRHLSLPARHAAQVAASLTWPRGEYPPPVDCGLKFLNVRSLVSSFTARPHPSSDEIHPFHRAKLTV
jgi:hypothetical protein